MKNIRWWLAAPAAVGLVLLMIWFPRPLFEQPLSTALLDAEGQLLGARIAEDGQWRFGGTDQIPEKFATALLTYEDQRFYQHPGIDFRSMVAAIWSQLNPGIKKRGGSTLSMQVMRLSLNNETRSVWSKIEEMLGAMILEFTHSKKEILRYYINNAPFGGNIVGIEAACWRYFGKNARDLSWAEACMLAVLPNQPSMIHISKNRKTLQQKRDRLLKNLLDKKLIDTLSYQLSLDELLPDKPLPLPSIAGHMVDHLTFKMGKRGILITSLNRDIQHMAANVAAKYNEIYREDFIDHLAILVLDNEKGNVVAYVGNTGGSPVDMIMSKRSSGSILKPLLYISAMDEGLITPWSLLSDVPIAINGYTPANFDRDFRGAVAADEALQRSLNIPFVLLLRKFGIARFLDKLKNSGISTLRKPAEHYGLSLILGGGEVNLWEISNVYSSLARLIAEYSNNGGRYRQRFFHEAKMMPPYLNFENLKTQADPVIFSSGSAYACVEALKKPGRPDEEGLWEEFSSHRPIAWKTGTSFGHRDAWSVGFDKKYTIGIWVGNASGKGRSNLTGMHRAAPVMFDVFNQLPDASWFLPPWDDMRQLEICHQSGGMATNFCPNKANRYLPQKTLKNIACTHHRECMISSLSGKRILNECSEDIPFVRDTFLVLSPAETAFYSRHHSDFKELPAIDKACLSGGWGDEKPGFSLIYPSENTRMYLPHNIAGKKQALVFKAHHYDPAARLYWYLDGEFLGSTLEFHSMDIRAGTGKHQLTLTDGTGIEIKRKFELLAR